MQRDSEGHGREGSGEEAAVPPERGAAAAVAQRYLLLSIYYRDRAIIGAEAPASPGSSLHIRRPQGAPLCGYLTLLY